MVKVTLDMDTFKALASDTRLDILRALDGKRMSLKDISKVTKLNKATLHEHLIKLNGAGLVKKKERDGHKWVYYKLTWKGEGLLHPENTRIVVLFSITFFSLFIAIVQAVNFVKGKIVGIANTFVGSDTTQIYAHIDDATIPVTLGSHGEKFNYAPNTICGYDCVSNIPAYNQTNEMLSQVLNGNASIRGAIGNTFSDSDIQWVNAPDSILKSLSNKRGLTGSLENEIVSGSGDMTDGAAEALSSTPQAMVAIVQDPILLYIAIGCVIVFTVLLSISIWRLWKNRTPKL